MINIAGKVIARSIDKLMKNVEGELKKSNEIYVDPKVNSRVEREISHLGKEKLLAGHIASLSEDFNDSNRAKILFLLVKLYNYNKQVHESLTNELKQDRRALNKRIKAKVLKNKVYQEIYGKLMKAANKHFNIVGDFVRKIKTGKRYPKSYVMEVAYHEKKAEDIYDAVINLKTREKLHKVLLLKLDEVYSSLIEFTVDLAKQIAILVKDVQSQRTRGLREKAGALQHIVSSKVIVLSDFAYKYSYEIIHSDHFFDLDGKKITIVTRNDHRHLAV